MLPILISSAKAVHKYNQKRIQQKYKVLYFNALTIETQGTLVVNISALLNKQKT